MYCRICGTENDVKWHAQNRGALCASCAETTPPKVGRAEFDAAYWGAEAATVPESTRREFYSDYRASCDTLAGYTERTTSAVM